MMPQIIINADDFGFSPAVNRAVIRLAETLNNGNHCFPTNVSFAASLMVNMPFADNAAEEAAKLHLPLALHFTLTSGRAVSAKEHIPALTDANGMFRHGFLPLWRNMSGSDFIAQIKLEFDAQIAEMQRLTQKYRLNWTGLDSHQHVHTLPDILPLVQAEAEKRKLRLRIPKESFGDWQRIRKRWTAWFPSGFIKRSILNWNCRNAAQTTGYFGILETGKIDTAALTEIIRVIQSRTASSTGFSQYEINIHPSDNITDTSNWCCSADDKRFHTSVRRRLEYDAVLYRSR